MNFFENFNDIMFAKLNFEVQHFFLFFHLFLNPSNTFSFDYLQKSENYDNIEIINFPFFKMQVQFFIFI
jgi:hypothetical protein